MSSSRGTPVARIVPSLTSVMRPSGLMVTRGSGVASMRLRAYCFWNRSSSVTRSSSRLCCSAMTASARFWAVTSRAAANTPSALPAASL